MAATVIKNGYAGGSDDQLKINSDGSINVNSSGSGTSSTNLTEVGGNAISLGQKTSANSLPVVIANDQSPISISGSVSGTVNTNINGLNAFATAQYVVGTSAVQITIPVGTSSVSLKAITTTSGDNVIVGNSNSVTNLINGSGNGYPLFNGDSVQIDITPSASLWVIGTSTGQIVCVLFGGG